MFIPVVDCNKHTQLVNPQTREQWHSWVVCFGHPLKVSYGLLWSWLAHDFLFNDSPSPVLREGLE